MRSIYGYLDNSFVQIALVICAFLIGTLSSGYRLPLSLKQINNPTATPIPIVNVSQIPEPSTSPTPTPEWKTYTNKAHGISFQYPSAWSERKDGKVFQQGDLFSIQIIGPTQNDGTEFSDGASFTIGIPVTSEKDAKTWAHDTYGEKSAVTDEPYVYSEEIIGEITFEKVYGCGLGCFTYYHTKHNDTIYGLLPLVEGPQKKEYEKAIRKMLESFTFTD